MKDFKTFLEENLKTVILVFVAILFAALALGHWGVFLIVMLAGCSLAIMKGVLSRSGVAWTIFSLTVVCLLYTVLIFPKVDAYMSENYPVFWSTVQQQRMAKDYEYGRSHAVAGNGIDAVDFRNSNILNERVANWYDSVTAALMRKETWTRQDSLEFRDLKIQAEQKRQAIQNLMGGGVLDVSGATAAGGSQVNGTAGRYAKLLTVDITSPDPTTIDVPQGSDLVIWIDAAHYAGFDTIGTVHTGARYASSKDTYEDFYVGAGGFPVSPRKGCSFPDMFPAPDLNLFATIYRSSLAKTWNMVPPQGKLTIPGSASESMTVEFTINDRLTTMEGNSGGLTIGYQFQPKSRIP
jgi:hypothetical protein